MQELVDSYNLSELSLNNPDVRNVISSILRVINKAQWTSSISRRLSHWENEKETILTLGQHWDNADELFIIGGTVQDSTTRNCVAMVHGTTEEGARFVDFVPGSLVLSEDTGGEEFVIREDDRSMQVFLPPEQSQAVIYQTNAVNGTKHSGVSRGIGTISAEGFNVFFHALQAEQAELNELGAQRHIGVAESVYKRRMTTL